MRLDRPPYWYWPLDRWKLLVTLVLVLALAVAVASGRGVSLSGRVAPSITQPASGDTLDSAAPGAIAGRAAPGAVVRIFDGEKLLGETQADQAGFFRLILPALAPGRHALTTRVMDAAGNVAATSPSISVTVAQPAAPKPAAAGPSTPAKATVPLTPTAGPAATTPQKPSATSMASGRSEVATPAASASRAPGVAASATSALPKEGTPAGAEAPVAMSGSATSGTVLRIYDGEALLGEAVADAGGHWNLVIPLLAPGQHTLAARVYNADGKLVSSSAPLSMTVTSPGGVVAPAPAAGTSAALSPVQITGPKPGAELSAIAPVLLEGTAPPASTVRVYDAEKLLIEAVAGSDGSWRVLLPPLTAGAHAIAARIPSINGSEPSSMPLTVTVKAAPAAAPTSAVAGASPAAGRPDISEPAPGRPVQSGQPVFSGTAAPDSIVRVYDGDILLGETKADAQGRWRLVSLFVLATGQHGVRVVGVGADGAEVAGASFELVIAAGATGLKPPVFVPSIGKAPSQVGLLQGVAPPGTMVTIAEGSAWLAKVRAGADGRWQYALPSSTSVGQHTYGITAAGADGAIVYRPEPITVTIEPAAQRSPTEP